ncbi:ATP/GTP-binding protein [Methanospirillum hungatei]|uniref:AAA family ATPase n=1 Tax=Methanospirillum hungatei TaxID=2203 RepID=UPI0026F15A9D|nr:AAA family ATPase [Methanospirillum hungatei]MCA1916969.1 AAA family ATPase [Methanospirillum hungatei]
MLKSITVKNFRGFQNVHCNNLSLINLVVGKNNVGKTAFLEALFLFFGRQNPGLAMHINASRGLGSVKIGSGSVMESPWNSIFYNFDITNPITITCQDEHDTLYLHISLNTSLDMNDIRDTYSESERILKIKDSGFVHVLNVTSSDEKEPYQLLLTNQGLRVNRIGISKTIAYYLHSRGIFDSKERAELFTSLDATGRTDEIVKAIQYIEPRLKRLSIGIIADEPIILGDIGAARLIPLSLMGDGTVRLFDLLIRIMNAQNGAVIIDEIENGIHHSVQEKIWTVIGTCAKRYNVQIFASTHSLECIKNAFAAFSTFHDQIFHVQRIERAGEDIRIKSFDMAKLETIFDLNLEVR